MSRRSTAEPKSAKATVATTQKKPQPHLTFAGVFFGGNEAQVNWLFRADFFKPCDVFKHGLTPVGDSYGFALWRIHQAHNTKLQIYLHKSKKMAEMFALTNEGE